VDEARYEFGRNWATYLDEHLDESRIAQAVDSLRAFTKLEDLRGRTFLDIGSGSGIFSLAAHRLGAASIVSFDYDESSVACTRALHEREGSPASWRVERGSVLDPAYLKGLGTFDIVYSWGVLHHTGAMWDAIRNASTCVAPGGLFYIAVYNSADSIGIHSDGRVGTARFWEKEKQFYCALPAPGRRVLDGLAAAALVGVYLLRGQDPREQIRAHRALRGMAWMVDIRDWLGGLPFEHARVDEVFRFVSGLGDFRLENLASTNSLMNNEFLFRRGGRARKRPRS
jgi:2-polyprenyl-6-hydroxyphenyl methylase/3-demethylubiquinone-9 3-methyltransferase